ncbi:VOC family protein [Patescibacteria group bacterium]|nr:VOC family protein [Patescibacteria group bacterium]
MQKITPFLWFDKQAEEAAKFYTTLFKNGSMGTIARYPEGSPGGMAGSVMTVAFTIDGTEFAAINA